MNHRTHRRLLLRRRLLKLIGPDVADVFWGIWFWGIWPYDSALVSGELCTSLVRA